MPKYLEEAKRAGSDVKRDDDGARGARLENSCASRFNQNCLLSSFGQNNRAKNVDTSFFFFLGKNSIRVEEKVAWTGKDEKISLYRLSHRTVQRYAHR